MNSLNYTTRNRLFLAILFGFLMVVGLGSVAVGDFKDAPNSGKLVYDAATKSWTSPGGLIYGQGSKHGNRVKHVLDHLKPNAGKPTHTLFNTTKDKLIGLLDEAWAKKGASVPGDPGAFIVDMGRVVGANGERFIKLIVKPGTNKVITAYPVIP